MKIAFVFPGQGSQSVGMMQSFGELCAEASANEVAESANFNSPAQVIAGNRAAVERGMEIANTRGAKRAVLLPMSVPSHRSLMQPAAERMREELGSTSFRRSTVRVLHNADVKSAESADAIKDALVRQMVQPVRSVERARKMVSNGVTHIVECQTRQGIDRTEQAKSRPKPGFFHSAMTRHSVRLCPC